MTRAIGIIAAAVMILLGGSLRATPTSDCGFGRLPRRDSALWQGASLFDAAVRALAVFVIACPCARAREASASRSAATGVNDGPALAAADLGIAVAGATGAALAMSLSSLTVLLNTLRLRG